MLFKVSKPSFDGTFRILSWSDAIDVSRKASTSHEYCLQSFGKEFRFVVYDREPIGPLSLPSLDGHETIPNALQFDKSVSLKQITNSSWDDLVAIALKAMNQRRKDYNKSLNNLFSVKKINLGRLIDGCTKAVLQPEDDQRKIHKFYARKFYARGCYIKHDATESCHLNHNIKTSISVTSLPKGKKGRKSSFYWSRDWWRTLRRL
ncbi:MAG: hypothetical protein WC575_02800 [Patescibacteria group bacterium]